MLEQGGINLKILFARHATMIITVDNKRILIDPVFSDVGDLPSVPNSICQSKNPLIKLDIPVEELVNVDSTIITHLHMDHFDTSAREKLPKIMKIFCQPEDEKNIKELGFENVTSINESINWEGLNIYRVDGKHGEGEVLQKMGKASGFILEDIKKYKLYIVGDSIWCEDVEKNIKRFNPNTIVINAGAATLPIGRSVTMNEFDIESVINSTIASKIIAIHMDAWNHCTLNKKTLKEFLYSKGFEDRVIIPMENTLINL